MTTFSNYRLKYLTECIILSLTISFTGCKGKNGDIESCNDFSSKKDIEITKDTHSDSLIKRYHDIIEGLNLSYVTYYDNSSYPVEAFYEYDSARYLLDSVNFYKSYQDFISQDLRFVTWLLTFENDTSHTLRWHQPLHPYNSYIGECFFGMSNSRVAINLVENYFAADGIRCYECKPQVYDSCNMIKYIQIKDFLERNKNHDIYELRYEWKKNAH